MVFTHDMSDWLDFNINKEWLEANISWKDFGTGVRLGKLKREDKCSLVLYDADSELLLTHLCLTCTLVEKHILYSRERFGMMRVLTQPDQLFGWTERQRILQKLRQDFDSCALARRCQSGLMLDSLPITRNKVFSVVIAIFVNDNQFKRFVVK